MQRSALVDGFGVDVDDQGLNFYNIGYRIVQVDDGLADPTGYTCDCGDVGVISGGINTYTQGFRYMAWY